MSHKERQGNPARRHGNLLGFALAAGAKLGSAPESRLKIFLLAMAAIHRCLIIDACELDPSLSRCKPAVFFLHSKQTK
jgi:hypothetical protein